MNNGIFYFFYNFAHQSVFLDTVIIFCAAYFQYVVILTAGIFLLFHHEVLNSNSPTQEFKKKWKEIILVFFISGFAWVIAKILKSIIHADRPFVVLSNVQALFPETGYAFPSGHATFFMALALALFFSHQKVGYIFMFFALIIGIARIAGGVHFPIDILGGFALGAFIGASVAFLLKNR